MGGAAHEQDVSESSGGGSGFSAVVEHFEHAAHGVDVGAAWTELVEDLFVSDYEYFHVVRSGGVDGGYAVALAEELGGRDYDHVRRLGGMDILVVEMADEARLGQRGGGGPGAVGAQAVVVVGPAGGFAVGCSAHGYGAARVCDVPDACLGRGAFEAERAAVRGEHEMAWGWEGQAAGVGEVDFVEVGYAQGAADADADA